MSKGELGVFCWTYKRRFGTVRPAEYIPLMHKDDILKNQFRGPYCPNGDIPGWQWKPYQLLSLNSPPFPEFPSGHSTFTSAAMGILALLTGSDNLPRVFRQPYKAGDLKYKFGQENHCFRNGTTFDGTRCVFQECAVDPTYNSENRFSPFKDGDIGPFRRFSQIAIQTGYSRLYGGIHVQSGNFGGLALGSRMANMLYESICSDYIGWRGCIAGRDNFAAITYPSVSLLLFFSIITFLF